MATSSPASANETTRFQAKVRQEYVRKGKFGPHIGPEQDNIIQVNQDLKKTSIALVTKITGGGVSGNTAMAGNETPLSDYDFTTQPTYWRQAVLVDNEDNEKAEFDLFKEARPALMNWTMEKKRDQIIQAMGAVWAGGTYYNYGGTEGAVGSTAAAAANMDTWLGTNETRVLYGTTQTHTAADHTTSLSGIASTEKMDVETISLLKRMAKRASPLIRPVTIKSDEPWYVFYMGSLGFRDIRIDLDSRHQNALPRDIKDNVLWTGGDLVYDGVIIKEVPEIDTFIDGDSSGSPWDGVWGANAASGDGLDNGGTSSARLGVGFFCGAQAVAFGLGRLPSFKRRKEDDYEHLNGIGITMKHDIKKTFYNNKQHGMITSFHAAAAD